MTLALGDTVPDFHAQTTEGPIDFHAGSVSNDEARQIFGEWKEPKPYIRIVPQPG